MRPKLKLEVLPPASRGPELPALDAFQVDRVQRDLARFANAPGLFAQYVERARSRFQKAGELEISERWTAVFAAGQRLISAKTEIERKKCEFLQLANEHEVKAMEKQTDIAKLAADMEEHNLRRDKAAYQRQHLESSEGQRVSENEQKLNENLQRRQLDCRWELHESLKALNSLVELQHWRRQQRDRVLKDRTLTPQEQSEDLQFIDDLYYQKHAELKVDTRIFEDS